MTALIIYSTQMGTTQMAASHAKEVINMATDWQAELVHVSSTSADQLSEYDLVIIATPTYDDGLPEPSFGPFLSQLKQQSYTSKPGLILCLGDSSYPDFCGAAEIVEASIEAAGMDLLKESLKIDNYMFQTTQANQEITEWLNSVLENLN